MGRRPRSPSAIARDQGICGARHSGPASWTAALGVVLALTLLRVLAATRLGLGDVEAYYWTWSQHLSSGYLDHGPVVAWLIRLGTAIGGDSTLAVRAPFVLISAATSLGCAALAARLAAEAERPAARLWAVLGLFAMPAFLVAGGAANPDVPFAALVVALLAVLLAADRAVRPCGWMALGGLLVGLAISTKLLGVLLLVPLLLGGARPRPRRLSNLLLGIGAAALGALPVLAWNLQHQWASFRYHMVLRHTRPPGPSLANLGKLLGGQLGYVSPLLLGALVVAALAVWRGRRSAPARTLFELSAPLLAAGFGLILVVPSAEPHWPMAGYLPLLVVLAARLPEAWHQRAAVRGLASAALALALLLGLGLHLHLLTDLGVRVMPAGYLPRLDLSNELHGWPAVAASLRAQRRPEEPVAGCHYTVCSQLAFVSHHAFPVICPSPRLDQFDLAPGGDGSARRGGDLIYVLDERFPFPADQLYRCDAVEELAPVRVMRGGRLVRFFRLQRCRGFRGLRELRWPPRALPAAKLT